MREIPGGNLRSPSYFLLVCIGQPKGFSLPPILHPLTEGWTQPFPDSLRVNELKGSSEDLSGVFLLNCILGWSMLSFILMRDSRKDIYDGIWTWTLKNILKNRRQLNSLIRSHPLSLPGFRFKKYSSSCLGHTWLSENLEALLKEAVYFMHP